MKAIDILKKFWGFEGFRENQEAIVQNVINGHDTFALLPTGGGKSICFQVPGLAREGVCIVVSPLIALMQDQVSNLKSRGIRAQAVCSGMSRREIDIALDNAKFGGIDFLYVSPERLKTELFLTRFKQMKVALIAIDEAHCISQWGHDFRPPYLDIAALREIHPEVPFIALTATATKRVQEEILHFLELKNPTCFESNFERPNISYEVYEVKNKLQAILKTCQRFQGNTGIVYCQTRKDTKEVARFLLANNVSAGIYNGGMDNDTRKKQLDLWMNNQIRVMVATNAFGMGIDKPDVRFVTHYELPNNLEAYFQEAGRAGRDGLAARTFAFYEASDLEVMEERLAKQFPPIDYVKTVYRALCNFFSIAIGSGDSESYALNIRGFVGRYNLDALMTFNALKILELNKTILLNEAVFHPTRVKIAVENKTLYSFQLKHDKYDPLISLLCRSYPGIFSNFFELHERQIMTRLKISKASLKEQLTFLEKQGVIDVVWQSDLPQVTLLHERLPDNYLRIDKQVYDTRKQVAEEKVQAMLDFVKVPQCRSVALLSYFGQQGKPCGKCDQCLASKKSNYSTDELVEHILTLLSNDSLSVEEIAEKLNIKAQNQLTNVLYWMLDEGMIGFEHNVFIKKD